MNRILIVEDSPTQAEQTRQTVESFGYTVEAAPDGEAGLAMLRESDFDLVLTDVVMPGMSGFDLCRAIKADSKLKDKPVVLVTSLDEPAHMIEALAAGADNYITKPFNEDYLKGRIQSLLLSRGLRDFRSFEMEVEVSFLGRQFTINSDRKQILGMLISTLEDIFHTNQELKAAHEELAEANRKIKAYAARLEGEVRVTEEKYRTLMAEASDAILLVNEHDTIIEANHQAEALLGRPAMEIVGRKTFEFIAKDGTEEFQALHDRLSRDGFLPQSGIRVTRADGSMRWVEYTAMTAEVEGQSIRMSILRDVTERQAQQRALGESEQRYRRIVDNSMQGILIVQDDEIAFCNDRLAQFFGYRASADIIGKRPLDFVHPDDRDEILAKREALLRGDASAKQVRYRGVRRDGSVAWFEALREGVDWEGRPAIHGAVMDVTDQIRAETQLRESEERYRSLVESSVVGTVILQGNRTVFCNRHYAEMHGYESAESLYEIDPLELLHSEDRERLSRAREETTTGDLGVSTEDRRAVRKDGSEFRVQASQQRVVWQGAPAIQISVIDITREHDLEQQLQSAQRMESIGQLAGGVSHDFNNILAVITSHSGFLLDELKPGSTEFEDAKVIQDAAGRAAALTRQLLAFSRKQVMQLKVMSVNDTIVNLEKMLRRMIGEDVKFRVDYDENLELVRADESQIEQIAMNLAVNARDAMPSGGSLTIETANVTLDENYVKSHIDTTPGRYVMFAVTDTGTGMDERTKARIFEPFFTTKPQGKGTGLGLSTVFGIVKQLNGGVHVYSEVGKGTTFKIYFPVTTELKVSEIPALERTAHTPNTGTILVVEDDDQVRKAAVRILKSQGYSVIDSSSARQAIDIARRHQGTIDLLLTDVVMPLMSGRDLWESIQADKNVSVLFMSGYTDDAIVNHGILEGRFPFINKPFSKDSLLAKVREVLNR